MSGGYFFALALNVSGFRGYKTPYRVAPSRAQGAVGIVQYLNDPVAAFLRNRIGFPRRPVAVWPLLNATVLSAAAGAVP